MSAGRQSWRAERVVKKGSKRRIVVALLSMTLAALLAGLGWISWKASQSEPPVRFISLIPPKPAPGPLALPTVPNAAGIASHEFLTGLFTKFNKAYNKHVMPPWSAGTLDALKKKFQKIGKGEKVIVYCALETVVRIDKRDSEKVVVSLLFAGGKTPFIEFPELLKTLTDTDASQIVLLMDLVGRSPGLGNGILADDVVKLVKDTVKTEAIPGLTVICSSDTGQRTWEYIANTPTDDQNTDNEPTTKDSLFSHHFSTTAFAHFVGEAFKQGKVDTPKMLHGYLDEEISLWVRDKNNYNEEQSVLILPETASIDPPRLLRKPLRLLAGFDEPEPDQKNSEDGSESPDSDKDTNQGKQEPETSTALWSRILERHANLPEDTAAVAEEEWMHLNAALVAMRLTLIHDIPTSRTMDEADDPDDIMDNLPSIAADDVPPAWIGATLAGGRSPDSNSAEKETKNGDGDNASDEETEDLSRLNDIVKTLSDLSQSITPQDSLTDLVSNTEILMKEWSRKSNWPHELFSLQKGFEAQSLLPRSNSAAPPDLSEQNIKVLETLGELINLRRRLLRLAAGYINADERILREVWDAQHGDVAASLVKINAAESWLTLGPEGLPRATTLIAELQKDGLINDLVKNVKAGQEQILTRHQQWTTTAAVIQFFAQQLEDVEMGTELDEVARVAEDANVWPDTLPEGIRSKLGEEVFKAMLAQVPLPTIHKDGESSADSTKRLPRGYAALEQDLTTRIDNKSKKGTARERLQLLALPLFESDKSVAERLMSWSDVSAGIADEKHNHTGIWLAYWSIRLLEAQQTSDVRIKTLQQEWRELVKAVSDDEVSEDKSSSKSNAIVLARTKLASSLQDAWNNCSFEDRSNLYVSAQVANPLLANDLAQRKKWDHSRSNRKPYEQIRGGFDGGTSLPLQRAGIAFAEPPPPLMLSASSQVNLHPRIEGGEYLFILPRTSSSGIQLTPVTAPGTDLEYVPEKNGAIRLSVADAAELALKISGLKNSTQFVLALADVNDIVLATQPITIHPNYSGTKWRAQFLVQDEESKKWKIHRSRGENVKLPPNVSGKPFQLRLVLDSAGMSVNRVQVTCWSIDRKNRKSKEIAVLDTNSAEGEPLTGFQIVQFDSKERGVEVSLAALPKEAVPDEYDVTNGFMFEITPVTPEGSEIEVDDFPLTVKPLIADATQYIKVPRPTYDHDTRKLTVPISFETLRDDFDGLRRDVTVAAHLSPALSALSKESSQTKTIPDPDRFEFTFDSDPFDSAPFGKKENGFEFGISVAEIPQAFRWSLERDGQPQRIGSEELEVRAVVDLTNTADVNVVDSYPHYLIGIPEDKSTEPVFNVSMYVYGFEEYRDAGSKLELRVRNQEQARSAAEAGPFVLNSPYQKDVILRPGDEGFWSFTTSMSAYVHSDLKLKKTGSNYKSGNYELTAQLTEEPDVNHVVKIVVDRTGPVITIDPPLKQNYRWGDLFKANIKVTDDESGIDKVNKFTAKLDTTPLLPETDTNPPQYMIKFRPNKLAQFTNIKQESVETANLVVTAYNRAGMPTTKTVTIGFGGDEKATPKRSETATVIVTWGDDSELEIRLLRKSNSKLTNILPGKREVTFKDLPLGEYNVLVRRDGASWTQNRAVTVHASTRKFSLKKEND
jgi:hypothetical protein